MYPRNVRYCLVGLLALAGASNSLLAQLAPAGANRAKAASDDEAVKLSPFEVNAASEEGTYAATSTLAGTRLNMALKDVPASISVMTADFLKDIGATGVSDAIQYGIGTEPDQSSANGNNTHDRDLAMTIRGFTNATLSRDYFGVLQSNAADNFNIERVTFSRGPNSVLFGSGSPGGIVDSSTKQAQPRSISQFSFRMGPFDDYRFTFDLNRQVTRTLAVRVNLLDWNKKSWRDFDHLNSKLGALAVKWTPFQDTTIRLQAEGGPTKQLQSQPWPALDGVTPWIVAGKPISTFANPSASTPLLPGTGRLTATNRVFVANSGAIISELGMLNSSIQRPFDAGNTLPVFTNQDVLPFSANVMGPSSTQDRRFLNEAIYVEQRLGPKLSLQLAASTQRANRQWNRPIFWNDAALKADPNAFLPGGAANPYVGQYYIETSRTEQDFGRQHQNEYRFSTSYGFDVPYFGSHQFSGLVSRRETFDDSATRIEAWINNPASADYTNAANRIIRRTYLSFDPNNSLGLPRGFKDPYQSTINAGGVTSAYFQNGLVKNHNRFDTVAGVLESRFFSGRLVTILGARQDHLAQYGSAIVQDPFTKVTTGATRLSPNVSTGNTVTKGIVYHVLPAVSVAVNKSNNSNPQSQFAYGPNGANLNIPLGPQKGEGMDGSLRFHLFGGRLEGSVGYFKTSQVNAQTTIGGNNAAGTSSYDLWLNQAYLALGKPNAAARYIQGSDTTDLDSKGWETEWLINVSRSFRFVANATKYETLASNIYPRAMPLAASVIAELKTNPDLPIANVGNATTAGALATVIQNQVALDLRSNGLAQLNSRDYNANLFANYRIQEGRLNGFSLSLGANIRGNRVIGYHSVTGKPMWAGDNTQYNGSISYNRKLPFLGKNVRWNATFSGTNIFGRRYGLLASRGNEFGVDRFFFQTTPSWFLTNSLNF